MSGLTDSRLFVPRLSAQASAELSQLQTIVSQVVLSNARDHRRGPFCLPQSKLDSGNLYRLLQSKDAPPHPAAKFIWETRAPPTSAVLDLANGSSQSSVPNKSIPQDDC
jgi:hypothetical protein